MFAKQTATQSVGREIVAFRCANNLSRRELAAIIGGSSEELARVERDVAPMSAELAQAFQRFVARTKQRASPAPCAAASGRVCGQVCNHARTLKPSQPLPTTIRTSKDLRALKVALGVNRRTLATLVGYSESTIKSYLRSNVVLSSRMAESAAAILARLKSPERTMCVMPAHSYTPAPPIPAATEVLVRHGISAAILARKLGCRRKTVDRRLREQSAFGARLTGRLNDILVRLERGEHIESIPDAPPRYHLHNNINNQRALRDTLIQLERGAISAKQALDLVMVFR